jgi:hypothetical protein
LDEKELHILKPLKDYYNRRRCYKGALEVQFLSLQPQTLLQNNYIEFDEFVEHGTVLELQQYYNIDVV